MVKADLTRDYYGDLEVPPNADANEIKKQFKKLALLYHPDRNPGRESEVTARFQRIQSAHEVLTDTHERTKYDANRIASHNNYRSGGNQKGNPWSNVSSQFPTPPKPPTSRARNPYAPPPPSAGAQRYKNFETPRQSASQSAHEGAEARRSTYEAWERMRETPKASKSGSGFAKPAPPPRRTPKTAPDDGPASKSSHHGSSHGQTPSKKGFMPNTPGGDEPAAPKGAYATYREKPAHPPPPSSSPYAQMHEEHADDSSRDSWGQPTPKPNPVQFEPRVSTPYATHGGEKFNPFETANMNRSKSTRVPSAKYSSSGLPRVGSDPNLHSPKRPQSQGPGFKKPDSKYEAPGFTDSSSSDESPPIRKKATPRGPTTTAGSRTFAKARSFTGSRSTTAPFPAPFPDGQASGSSRSQNTDTPAHEQPAASGQTNPQKTQEQKMYEQPYYTSKHSTREKSGFKLPTVSEQVPSPKYFNLSPEPTDFHSKGGPDGPESYLDPVLQDLFSHLFPLEETQRSMLDLLIKKRDSNGSSTESGESNEKLGSNGGNTKLPTERTSKPKPSAFSQYRESPNVASQHKKPKLHENLFAGYNEYEKSPDPYRNHTYSIDTNFNDDSRFSFGGDGTTFQPAGSSGFNPPSTESVNTKFAADQWHQKFEALHFAPDLSSAKPPNPRTQSGSRSRGRSPVKSRSSEKSPKQARVDPDSSESSSLGSTKFSQDEWAKTFKTQTFMPPPPVMTPASRTPRKSRVSSIKPTMGTAAVVEDEDASDDKPLFKGRKASTATAVPSAQSPEPMDVDTPAESSTPLNGERKADRQFQQSPVPSPPSTDTESLKINFEDLKIRDLISTLNLPRPPVAPQIPAALLPPTKDTVAAYLEKFRGYMGDWDLFNNRMMLHLVARKNQNDSLGPTRWMNVEGLAFYRKGLQEDSAVIKWWNSAIERHGENMKQCQVLKAAGRGQTAQANAV